MKILYLCGWGNSILNSVRMSDESHRKFALVSPGAPVRHMASGLPGGSFNTTYFVLCGGGLTAALVYVSILAYTSDTVSRDQNKTIILCLWDAACETETRGSLRLCLSPIRYSNFTLLCNSEWSHPASEAQTSWSTDSPQWEELCTQ